MLALQQQIASDIARAAGWAAPAGGNGRIRLSIDPQAYEAYMKGVTSMGMPYESNRRAVVYFEEAIARQPDFAQAYAELAVAQFQFLFSGPLSPREAIPKAEAAARRAVELDETLARAHWMVGQILSTFHWKWAEADAAYLRADRLRVPGRTPSHDIPFSAGPGGRFAEAIAVAEHARALDPLSYSAQMDVGIAYRASGQHARAVEEFRRAQSWTLGTAATISSLVRHSSQWAAWTKPSVSSRPRWHNRKARDRDYRHTSHSRSLPRTDRRRPAAF